MFREHVRRARYRMNHIESSEEASLSERSILTDSVHESDNYENLVQLDHDVIRPVPARILNNLPTSTFTTANASNFSEENKQCTICMY